MLKYVGYLMVVALLVLTAGCGRKQDGVFLHFVFEDARGITVGDKVMGDGVEVGRVLMPPESPKPKHVVVSVRIDGLSEDKRQYLTEEASAVIRKDSLVAGQTYLDLVFADQPGVPVADGTILKGRGGPTGVLDVGGIRMPSDPGQFVDMLGNAFAATDIDRAGPTVFYLNWGNLAVVVLAVIAMLLDFLIRLPQGRFRERSSPKVFLTIWLLFTAFLVVRIFVGTIRVMGDMGVVGLELLQAVGIGTISFMDLLAQEWPFWLLVVVIITLRFKFDLMMKARKR